LPICKPVTPCVGIKIFIWAPGGMLLWYLKNFTELYEPKDWNDLRFYGNTHFPVNPVVVVKIVPPPLATRSQVSAIPASITTKKI
jgi:hypothetical protein